MLLLVSRGNQFLPILNYPDILFYENYLTKYSQKLFLANQIHFTLYSVRLNEINSKGLTCKLLYKLSPLQVATYHSWIARDLNSSVHWSG